MVTRKTAIVTAADERYATVARGLLKSIAALSLDADVFMFDIGLETESVQTLGDFGEVITCQRDDAINRDSTATVSPSCNVRMRLPDLVAGYDNYIWIDSDAWVQADWAITNLREACAQSGFAVVPEIDCCYIELFQKNSQHWNVNHRWYKSGFGATVADDLIKRPVFNSGVWAASANSAIWSRWSKRFEEASLRSRGTVNDQAALNVALYQDHVPFHPLPSIHNWVCSHALPRWDGHAFCRPAVPFEPLGIIHLTSACVDTDIQLRNAQGDLFTTRLDYESIQQLRQSEIDAT